MPFSNNHLLRIPQRHENITGNCFCDLCRDLRLEVAKNERNVNIYVDFQHYLPRREEVCLDKLFGNTLQLFVRAKAYRDSSLEGTEYRYFKSWAKNQGQFRHLSKEELSKFAERINQCAFVYEHWPLIATNLADPRITEIDARRLSTNQFYRAANMDWCLSYNEILRKKLGHLRHLGT